MKKIISVIILALMLVSCKGEANADQSVENPPASKTALGEKESNGKAIHLTKDDFLEKVMNYEENSSEWKYEGDLPCIVDFYADWCGPCKIASPILDELAAEYEGQIYVYKVDTEVERELAGVFGIRSIPTFLLVPMEGQPSMSSGIGRTAEETKDMFKRIIEEFLLADEQKDA